MRHEDRTPAPMGADGADNLRLQSPFRIPTPAMAKAFFALTAAALMLAGLFSYGMNAHQADLIYRAAEKKKNLEREQIVVARRKAAQQERQQILARAVPQQFPASGSVQWKQVYPAGIATSQLTITDLTQDNRDKIIEIHDAASQTHVANLYLGANQQATVDLPATTYRIDLVQGREWRGAELNYDLTREATPLGNFNLNRPYELNLKFTR